MFARNETLNAAVKFASGFASQLSLDSDAQQRCEWNCILWSKEYWRQRAEKSKIGLQESKQRSSHQPGGSESLHAMYFESEFLNTISQVYSRIFDGREESCEVKNFERCPYKAQRESLLRRGCLASVFATILQKAVFYSMLERHPLDSGLLPEEYTDVYGINLIDFADLEHSLTDGRFENLYTMVLKKATQLAGPRSTRSFTS